MAPVAIKSSGMPGRITMQSSTAAVGVAMAAALMLTIGAVRAADAKYPNWKGQWSRVIPNGER
jgi:hypothetical protein